MKYFSFKLLFFLFVITISGCKKDANILGIGVQPSDDILNASFSDTSSVYAYTQKCDSTASVNSDAYKYLGSNQDPYFGRTDIGLYVNANLITSNVDFTKSASLDSSEIILRVVGLANFVGDKNTPLTYSVFPIVSSLSTNTLYYTNNNYLHNPNATPLGVYTGSLSMLSGGYVVRIPIDKNFAANILQDSANLVSNDIFQLKYKGFYVTASGSNLNPFSSQGIIAKYDMDDDLTGFYLYYKNNGTNKSFKFGFTGTNAVRFNTAKYRPNDGGNYLLTKQLDGDTAAGKESLFLKGMGQTKIKVTIPFLKNYADSFKVAVNRAELVFNIDPSFVSGSTNYVVPPRLALLPISSTGSDSIPYDYNNTTDYDRYDGYFDSDNNRYVFNIARHVQAILGGKVKNNGFVLVVSNLEYPNPYTYYVNGVAQKTFRRDNYIERVILAGSNKGTLKPKFSLSFIKYKKD